MIELKRLLVPLDFSPCSFRALSVAVSFSRHFGSKIVVVHVLEGPNFTASVREMERRLNGIAPPIPSDVAPRTSFRLERGDAAEKICAMAALLRTNLIVAGRYGDRDDGRVGTGSVAAHLMKRAPCVVVSVDDGSPSAAFDLMNLAVLHAARAEVTSASVQSASPLGAGLLREAVG